MKSQAQFPEENSEQGEFVRQEDAFREWVRADGSSPYPAASGRYHLYVSLACPWAHRTILMRKLKGLESAIGMSVVDPIRDERGWAFREGPGNTPDTANGFAFLSEAYLACDPKYRGRYTVPVLWDRQTRRIVNNSEDDIMRMFNREFDAWGNAGLDFYPADLRAEIDRMNDVVYGTLNNGVYRAGFATSQAAYEKAVYPVFATLDLMEDRLGRQRYAHGARLTETDWRIFVTLVRFDAVYYGHFKCNLRRIVDYPNLFGYLRDLYQHPGVAETVNFDHIKRHYYATHEEINPTRIVPVGPIQNLGAPHDRVDLDERAMKHDPSRRDFLATGGILATVALMAPHRILASAAGPSAFEKLIPPDKQLDPAWVDSLFARGKPRVYSGSELEFIGMPVSGLCSGHLYLGGDGKLWLWDIFNIYRYTSDVEYRNPIKPFSPVDQGFALRVSEPGGEARIWSLDAKGFPGVTFRGEYPMGCVEYRDAACPVTVALEAFSPFAPLDTDDSSLPATLMRFTIKNPGAQRLEVDIGGWLENKAGLQTETVTEGFRKNRVVRAPGLLLVEGSVHPGSPDAPASEGRFEGFLDIGTLGLALLGAGSADRAIPRTTGEMPRGVFAAPTATEAEAPFGTWYPGDKFIGAIVRSLVLAPGEEAVVTYALAWHFPNLRVRKVHKASGRYYANRFKSARDVAGFLSANHERLHAQTRLWRDTWYDSTLPYWFLDRTLANASTLATSTAYRFSNGRFYGWEGVGNCTGTCTHVWSYEQTLGRLFPELDRALMEKSCFNPGVSLHPDGQINFRDESNCYAVDGQAGTILRAYRVHQMSPDSSFLRRNWTNIRSAVEWLMAQDADADGILDRNQNNTLDAEWYGKVAWLSGLYIAALRAAEEMALETNDRTFAARCRPRIEAGRKNITGQLWNGRYFIQTVDPLHPGVVGSYAGCEIDQVLGQSWAFQAGLGRILPESETRQALQSLWRYNFAPDVGPYRAVHPSGRWFAMPGEAGLLMCTQPDGTDRDFKDPPGSWTQVYLNECMNGFEHQAAGHMIWEGLVLEGLAVERAVHDRYEASKRNPWNEIECGNHYARSMASFGVFLAACGYEYHGPKGRLAFAPRIRPEDFRAAFVTAEGWGSYSQIIDAGGQSAVVEMKWGSLRLRSFAVVTPRAAATVDARVNGQSVPAGHRLEGRQLTVDFAAEVRLAAGDRLSLVIS